MLRRLSICVLFFVCLSLYAQGPGGQANEVQTNNGSGAFSGSNLFTNGSNHTSLYSSVPYSLWGYNSPQTYGGVNSQTMHNCLQDVAVGNSGIGASVCNFQNLLFTMPGLNYGNPANNSTTGNAGWSVTKFNYMLDNVFTPGIHQAYNLFLNAGKTGDDAAFYAYCYNQGGWNDASGEGHTCIRANGGNDSSKIFTGSATATTSAGATSVKIQPYSGFPLVNGFLIDETRGPVVNGNATNYDSSSQTLTAAAGTFTKATSIGTVSNFIVVKPPSVDGATVQVTVQLASGATPFSNGLITFGCDDSLDFVNATVGTATSGTQTITGIFAHGHQQNCLVAQGGTEGVLDFYADRIGSHYKTSYYVFAAPDDSHIKVRTYLAGTLGFINPWQHNYGTTATISSLTRSGGVAKACNVQNVYAFSGQAISVSSTADSTFNTPANSSVTASNVDTNSCFTWSNAGNDRTAPISGTVTTGGLVGGTTGLGSFSVWSAAMVKNVMTDPTTPPNPPGTVQAAFNGGLTLYPNQLQINQGDQVTVLFDMQNKTEPLAALGVEDTPPPGPTPTAWFRAGTQGRGVATTNFHLAEFINYNPWNTYQGGGGSGQLTAPLGIWMKGPYSLNFQMDAPLPNGIAIDISNNPVMTGGFASAYWPLSARAKNGNIGFGINFDPIAGRTVISSSDGTGVNASLVMDKTTITASQTNGLILQNIPTGTCAYGLAADSTQKVIRTRCFQIVTGSGCTITAGVIGNSCSQILQIPVTYPNTSYDVTGCTVTGGGLSVIANVANTSASTLTVTQVAMSTSSAGGGTIKCIVSE